jgi:hypothetical protein
MTDVTVYVEPVEITATISTTGLQGPRGVAGPAGEDARLADIGEITSAGLAGVEVAVIGMDSETDYIVDLAYAENPRGNGVLFYERAVDKFTVKHAGTHYVAVSYVVIRKVTP